MRVESLMLNVVDTGVDLKTHERNTNLLLLHIDCTAHNVSIRGDSLESWCDEHAEMSARPTCAPAYTAVHPIWRVWCETKRSWRLDSCLLQLLTAMWVPGRHP